MESIVIDNLYSSREFVTYFYIINDGTYNIYNLRRITMNTDNVREEPFNISPNGSQLLLIITSRGKIVFQEINGRFIQITPRFDIEDTEFESASKILVPLPGGREINGIFEELPLREFNEEIEDRVNSAFEMSVISNQSFYDDILELINEPPFPQVREESLAGFQETRRLIQERIPNSREGGTLRMQLENYLEDIETDMQNFQPQINIYVSNTSPRTSTRDISLIFSEAGSISDIRTLPNYYVVIYNNQESVNNALRLNGQMLDGSVLRVSLNPVDENSTEPQPIPVVEDTLTKQSHAMYMAQVYGLPVITPDYLIINGLRVNFISFQEISSMLSQNQIERYIIEPVLQPWAGPPSSLQRILTFFGKNGETYLAKVRYDQANNQIFSP